MNIDELVGKIITDIRKSPDDDELLFTTTENKLYKMNHYQNCCECVYLNDIIGDLDDLIGTPILLAEERTSDEPTEEVNLDMYYSFTWTFYTFRTIKGTVTLRWLGTSNGYYSESVDFEGVEE